MTFRLRSTGARVVALALAPLLLAACGDSEPTASVTNPLEVDADTLDFGLRAPGSMGFVQLDVTNTGTAPFTVAAKVTPGSSFAVDTAGSDPCLVTPLAPGESCVIGVDFEGTTAGSHEAELTLGTGRRGEAPRTVQLAGTIGVHVMIAFAGTGQGSVTNAATGDRCNLTCTLLVAPGPVTLTATPGAASYFGGWSGDCTGTGTCTMTPAPDEVVHASFGRYPETTFTSAPLGATNSTTVRWAFESDLGTSFECSLNTAAFAACTSPYTATGLTVGANHTLRVRAVDAAGQADPTPASSSVTVTLDTPLLRYHFDGNALNSGAIGGYDGTATRVTYPAGKFANAVKFDGSATTSVLFPGTAAVLGRGGPLTISLWYREDAAVAGTHLLDFRSSGANDRGWETYHGAAGATLTTTCGGASCASYTTPALGAWHNLTYRYATSGGQVELYVDGAPVATLPNASSMPITGASPRDLVLGNSYYGNPSVFYVDEVKIYDAAFTPAEQCTRVIGGTWNGTSCTMP